MNYFLSIIFINKNNLYLLHIIYSSAGPQSNNNNNNNNGNFICVFECTIVNLATYRQFANAAWDWIIKKKRKKQKQKQKQNKSQKKRRRKKKKSKLYQVWAIPVPISTTKDVICYSNGYIYNFLDYIKLLLLVNANVIHHV